LTKGEFWLQYSNNLEYGLLWILVIGLFYFLIFRKYVYSIFDPLMLHLLMSAIAYSVVFFLYQFDLINSYYFQSFLFTQLAFIFGFVLVRPVVIKSINKYDKSDQLAYSTSTHYMYYISFFIYISSQVVTYFFSGVPLLMESRLESYSGGSGFGIFGRFVLVSTTIILVIAFYNIFFTKKTNNFFDKLVIFIVILGAILSGGKSALISVYFILFYVIFFNFRILNEKIKKIKKTVDKFKWWVMLAMIIIVLGIINIHLSTRFGSDNTIDPVYVLLMRFVNTADVFFLVYPDGFINNAKEANPFLALFSGFFGAFRIFPWESLPDSISLQLYQILHNTDLIEGPNTRHNVFGLFYFGNILSIIFSFMLGLLVSFTRNKLYFMVDKSVNGMILYILLVANILAFEVDPVMAVNNYVSIIIVFTPIYLISRILSFNQIKLRKKDLND
jgi:hypothetical protein